MPEGLNVGDYAPMIAGFAVLGTALAAVFRGWTSIKEFLVSLSGIVLITVKLDDETTIKATIAHLIDKYPRLESGKRTYSGKHENFRNGKYGYVPYEMMGENSILFWYGYIPFWLYIKDPPKEEGKEVIVWGVKPKVPKHAFLIFFRYSIDIDAIIKEASRVRNSVYWNTIEQENHKRFFIKKIPDPLSEYGQRSFASANFEWFHEGIYRLVDHKRTELGRANEDSNTKATDKLFFPQHVKDLITEVKTWHSLKEWYNERNIPWKRGWCLYGPPGTGKTALVRALAEDLDMPLFVYSLGRITDKDLELSWNQMQAHSPCIALFEDFDTVFDGRKNIYGKATLSDIIHANGTRNDDDDNLGSSDVGKLSFGCLLNCMDGVDKNNGVFTIITTNHINKLDEALGHPRKNADGSMDFISTRPGRIDKAIELGYMSQEDKLLFARRIFDKDEIGFNLIRDYIFKEDKQETPAQFQERCSQLALELIWKNK